MTDLLDPVKFVRTFWPDIVLYREQEDILYSLRDNDETYVPAGNMLGKDFITGLAVLWFFVSRHPVRVVTTSADHSQLEAVLWGEIRRFLRTATIPLDAHKGGVVIANHLHLRKQVNGKVCGLSYCIGRVAAKGEGLLGHHIAHTGDGIPRTLFVADEASGVDDEAHQRATTWARRMLVIGNPYPCENFFKHAVKGRPGTDDRGGDIPRPVPSIRLSSPQETPRPGSRGYYRKVIRIQATQSPNVRYALAQQSQGIDPTGKVVLPGVLSWEDYAKRRATWDAVRQTVGLDANFWEGADALMFPPEWLDRAETIARSLAGTVRQAKAIGIDPAEGGDRTAMCAVDELGVIELVSKKTPDTSVITKEAVDFLNRHRVPPEMVLFDRGGGGKQHADRLREMGYHVRSVGFGETVTPELRRGLTTIDVRKDQRAEQYEYKNRRAQMYGILRELVDPAWNPRGFGIPSHLPSAVELRRQLAPMPLLFDGEGRLRMLPKDKRTEGSEEKTLKELLGCSPDEADALVLAVYGMIRKERRPVAGG